MRAALLALGLVAVALAGCTAPAVQPAGLTTPALPPLPSFLPAVHVGDYGNEPVVRADGNGTVYVAALQYLYVSHDGGASFAPVDFKGLIPVYASDSALALAPDGRAYVAFDWPYAGSTAVCTSSDRAETWSCDPLAVPGATDRMWLLAPTAKDAYLITGQTLDRPTFAVSHDAGATWSITSFDPLTASQGADLAWDPVQQLVVEGAASGDGSGWGARTWKPDGTYLGFAPIDLRTKEPTIAIDVAGTWWANACAGNGSCAPAAARSLDHGRTWTVQPLPAQGKSFLFPFPAAGARDHVAFAWYESEAGSADAKDAAWRVAVARTADGARWARDVLTPDPVHTGAMCGSATCLGEDRFAGDFLGVAWDGAGALHVAWEQQTARKLLPTGQQPPPLPSWEQVAYARAGPSQP